MAVHTFADYSASINRFSPKYDDAICKRVGGIKRLMQHHIQSMIQSLMILDMLKAHAFYGKPVHEALDYAIEKDANPVSAQLAQFYHGLTGLLTELNETWIGLCTKGIAEINGVEEVGDILWFANELSKSLGTTLGIAAAVNEAKLNTRYGNAHDSGKAINRDKEKERIAMEKAKLEATLVAESEAVRIDRTPGGWREKFAQTFVMSGMNSNKPELLFRVWGNGTMSIALPDHVEQFIEIEVLGEYDPDKDVRNESKTPSDDEDAKLIYELKNLIAQMLPAIEDAAKHNAANSQRVTVARAREIIGLPPRTYRHGDNYDGNGTKLDRTAGSGLPSNADGGDQGGRKPDGSPEAGG